jgi:hypothetical protein
MDSAIDKCFAPFGEISGDASASTLAEAGI